MAIFILLFNLLSQLRFIAGSDLDTPHLSSNSLTKETQKGAGPTPDIRDAFKEENLKRAIEEKRGLAILFTIVSLSMVLTLFFGILLTVRFIILKIRRSPILSSTYLEACLPAGREGKRKSGSWGIAEIFRIGITLAFFAHLIHILEVIVVIVFKVRWMDKYTIAFLNTFLLDIIAVSLIIYLTKVKYNQTLQELGLHLHNFFKSIFLGLAGYITVLPTLVFILFVVLWMVNLFNYQSPPQPIFDFLFYEKRGWFLFLSAIFVALLAPIVEEILFRGFIYTAIRNKFGKSNAYLLSAILFAGLHANLIGFLPISLLGILLAYLYEHSGSLIPSIAVHVTHNSLIVLFVFLVRGII